jgi:hypothetical protein
MPYRRIIMNHSAHLKLLPTLEDVDKIAFYLIKEDLVSHSKWPLYKNDGSFNGYIQRLIDLGLIEPNQFGFILTHRGECFAKHESLSLPATEFLIAYHKANKMYLEEGFPVIGKEASPEQFLLMTDFYKQHEDEKTFPLNGLKYLYGEEALQIATQGLKLTNLVSCTTFYETDTDNEYALTCYHIWVNNLGYQWLKDHIGKPRFLEVINPNFLAKIQ